jgi:hypothetical protein
MTDEDRRANFVNLSAEKPQNPGSIGQVAGFPDNGALHCHERVGRQDHLVGMFPSHGQPFAHGVPGGQFAQSEIAIKSLRHVRRCRFKLQSRTRQQLAATGRIGSKQQGRIQAAGRAMRAHVERQLAAFMSY